MHGGRPTQVFVEQASTFVVDVIGIAVVCRAQRNDGFESFGPHGRDLQAVETTPRNSHHAHVARAPWLLACPGDYSAGVVQFLLRVLVEHDAIRVAVTTHVHPHTGVAMAGNIGVG